MPVFKRYCGSKPLVGRLGSLHAQAGRSNDINQRVNKENWMTKADLIEEVSRVVEMTRKESEVIVEAIFDSIVRSLRTGDKIEIRGFGSFRTRQRQPRIGRNPKTGARVEVPAKKIPYFKPSKELKDVVNASAAVPADPSAPEQVPNA
ncbi:MAG TPA: HU family DNA-binding protein [Bryobacteraceae bacterium]